MNRSTNDSSPRSSERWETRIEMETVSEANQREHWRSRHQRRKAQRDLVCWSFRLSKRKPPELPVTVHLVRVAPRKLDREDNLPMAMKAVRDQIAQELGVDDNDPRVTWTYDQRKDGRPNSRAVEITITRREA